VPSVAAVGVDFDRRAELFDEALAALWSIWVDPDVPVSGADFEAPDPVWLQSPTQRPHPPIWIGGNGKAALRRVVEYGSGWMPIIAPAGMASVIRTAAIENARQFAGALDQLKDQMDEAGRDPSSMSWPASERTGRSCRSTDRTRRPPLTSSRPSGRPSLPVDDAGRNAVAENRPKSRHGVTYGEAAAVSGHRPEGTPAPASRSSRRWS